jgi:fructokinase
MQKHIVISVGEILFDIFPGYKRIGGAPFNFAYHMLKIGMPVCFITKIGKDVMGGDIMNFLDLNGFDTRHVQQDAHYETGKVMVTLDSQGNPVFDILKDMAYDYINFDSGISAVLQQKPDLIYLGTLAQRTEHGHKTIQKILSAKDPVTRCLYDVNLRPDCYSEQIVKASLRQSDIVKMNAEELEIIKTMFGFSNSNRTFIDYLMKNFGIEMISLTKGKDGSELFTVADSYHMKHDPIEINGDTVGAGDAYASILALGYLNRWQPEIILKKATELAERVCSIKGALPKATDFYDNLIDHEQEAV